MRKITYSFPAVILISLVIQVLGLIRSLILARNFGANAQLDTFYLANVFTISVFSVIGSGITTIVIPELNADLAFQQKKTYIEKYLTYIRIFALGISLLLFITICLGKNLVVPRFSYENKMLFLFLTGVLLISQQFKIQAAFSVSLLQNEGHYILPRFMDIIPVLIPAMYLLAVSEVDLKILAILTALAYILETLIFNIIQRKMNPLFDFKLKLGMDADVRKMIRNTIPVLLSSTVFQIQVLVSNYFAGFFGHGYITLLSNTNQIMSIFQALFVMNLITMIYPKLVKEIKKNLLNGISQISKYVSLTNLVVIILIWGYAAIGFDLVKLLFVRGAFTTVEANVVYKYGLILGMAIPIDVLRDYSYRTYYALENTRQPMNNSIITVAFNIIMLIVLAKTIGPVCIVLAPAIGTVFSTCTILIRSYRDNIRVNIRKIILNYLLTNFLGIAMYLVIRIIHFTSTMLLEEIIINILIGASFIAISIFVLALLFKLFKRDLVKFFL